MPAQPAHPLPALVALLTELGTPDARRLCASLARSPEAVGPPGDSSPLALIDRELARLFAVRELVLAWAEEARHGGAPAQSPAGFLRAWSDSSGRVLALLRARRELSAPRGAPADALLDALYEELERSLPGGPGEGELSAPAHGSGPASAPSRPAEAR